MSRELLLEIGTEDLPARYVMPLAEALRRGIGGGLQKRGLVCGTATIFATPRRIAVRIADVPEHQPDQIIERLGPALQAALKDGQPTPAALGFAKSCGVEFAALEHKDGKLYYRKPTPGRAVAELLPEIFEDTLKEMDALVPKRMRWGEGSETFVRPVQWLTCLLGTEVVPLSRFELTAGALTYGHRFHAPDAITLRTAADYEAALKTAKVWADVDSRKAEIRRQIVAEGARLNGHVRITEDLLDEVTALVEWPVAIVGHFEARFLELPPEVIVATVETNQRYFTVFKDAAQTQLTNAFVTVSNIESRDVAQVIAGNERVVRPRLTDALFFWQQDLKQPLARYGEKLAAVTFQKDLGSTGAKVARIRALAGHIAKTLGADAAAVDRAAELCKADLVTKMVYEFPELQGLMGGYYAARAGESPAVATAIREHYLPTQQGTPIPSTKEGQIVALADKLDTLAGIFAIGQKPTASKDPYALRRAALGVLRICLEAELSVGLADLLTAALAAQPAGKLEATTLTELIDFVHERLKYLYAAQGLPPEMFEAAAAVQSKSIAIADLDSRVDALRRFWDLPDAKDLAAAHKRSRKILEQVKEAIPDRLPARFMANSTQQDRAITSQLEALDRKFDEQLSGVFADQPDIDRKIRERSSTPLKDLYFQSLKDLAGLRPVIDAFFNQTAMIMDPDPDLRAGRLCALRKFDHLCLRIADISLLPSG